MNSIMEQGTVILLAIIGVAMVAILVSNKANTTGVLQAAGSAFSNALGVAESPVSGTSLSLNLGYPGSPGMLQ